MMNELKGVDKTLEKSGKVTELTYKAILSTAPPKEIIKHHKYGNFDYLPITAIERLLDGLFESWTVEVLREGQVFNGFYCTVRLSAKIPNSDKIMVSDGIGFAELQTKKDALPTDLAQIIQGAGVLAVPRAKTEAVKNAAKSFGNLFGRNLTRKDDQAMAEITEVNRSRSEIAKTLEAQNRQNTGGTR